MPKKKSEPGQKKDKRMVQTNIKVTKEAHGLIKFAADKLGMPMSDAIIFIVGKVYPNADQEIKEREAAQAEYEERRGKSN